MSSSSEDEGSPCPKLIDLIPHLPMIDPCNATMWVSEIDMSAAGARLLHTYFPDKKGREILTYVSTKKFFELHKELAAREIFKTANMAGYFKLKPWDPDLRRAWELVRFINKTGAAIITDFDGHQVQVNISPKVFRDALHIGHQGIFLPLGNLTASERRAVSVRERSTFSELRHPEIRQALQLYMQHFNLSLAQWYMRPEMQIASLFTKA